MSSDVRIRHNHTPSDRADPDQSKSDQRASDDRIRTYSHKARRLSGCWPEGDPMAKPRSEEIQECPPPADSGTDFFEDMRVIIERRRAAPPASEVWTNLLARLDEQWRSAVTTMERPGG